MTDHKFETTHDGTFCIYCALTEEEHDTSPSNTSEAEQELIANIARTMGVSKHTGAMKTVAKLIASHQEASNTAARIKELRLMKRDGLFYHSPIQLDYLNDRIAALTQPKVGEDGRVV